MSPIVKALLALILFVSSCPAVSQGVVDKNGKIVERNNGFVFVLSKEGKCSYLVGTIHGGFKSSYELGSKLKEVLYKSSKIYLEADIRDAEKTIFLTKKYATLQDQTLSDIIPAQYLSSIQRNLNVAGIRFESVERLKPWLVASLLMTNSGHPGLAPRYEFGTEKQIYDWAIENSRPLSELEGLGHQYQIFEDLTTEQNVRYIVDWKAIIDRGLAWKIQHTEIEAWSESRSAPFLAMLQALRDDDSFYSRFYLTRVIYSRSKFFAGEIARLSGAKSGPLLFAIGAEHLFGTDNVVDLLTKEGFEVLRLN